jgi:hypothetical protein
VTKDRGIGDEPNNSTKCSEVADGVARQSEGSPNFRFYALYDKVYREDVMAFAYEAARGAPALFHVIDLRDLQFGSVISSFVFGDTVW